MDELAEKDETTPEKISVRRRLVQSTLFQQKSQEIEFKVGDHNADKDCEVNGDDEDDQDFCCGSQGKKTRKRKGKTTPPVTKAPNKIKERSPKNKTPKKNGKIVKDSVESEDASPPSIPNLRLEAKLKAEEYSRMFTGKQLHPFFSSWKTEKKNQNGKEVDSNCSSSGRKDKSNTISPIHVFDRSQDEVLSIDWSNWTFFEETVDNRNCLEGKVSSAFDGFVESLKLDKLSCVPYPNNASSDQCHREEHLNESSSEVSVLLVDDHEDHQLEQVTYFPKHAVSMKISEVEEKISSVQESSRMMSYCYGCAHRPGDSLWTDKYRPKSATELCGNSESVKFISEWLHIWHERDVRGFKDSSGSENCSVPDDNHDCYLDDSDSENIDEGDSLKNVLLVTGPIGSGKSAAIHACANERGFKVLENNASDCRQGAIVKQKFGGALESNCLKRSMGNPLDSPNKNIMKSSSTLSLSEAAQHVDDEVIEVIHVSNDDNSHGVMGKLDNHVKPLILIEDVDVFFPEDRGFIAAIQQIAEKAKGPVILTSNSNNITLPDSLDRLEVSFTMPTTKDLLSHLHMICAAEKVELQPHFLVQLIESCQADIRKTIMHLQFWCQNKGYGKDKKLQKLYGPELFDLDAGHHILPKIIPWGFPSQLSELVDKEIMKSLSLMEENSTLREISVGEGQDEMPSNQDMHNNPAAGVEAKKEEMLNMNSSVHANNELEDLLGNEYELSNFPHTPVSFFRRTIKRKFNGITSSDSEDELIRNKSPVAERDVNSKFLSEDHSRFPSHFSNAQNCQSPPIDKLLYPLEEKLEGSHYLCSEVANDLQIGTCRSVDISCVPESSFVPETEIDNGAELLSGKECSGYVAETVEVSVVNEFNLNLPPVEADNNSMLEMHRNPDMLEKFCAVIAESSHVEEVEDFQNEHVETISRACQLMDECSRMDFKRISKPMEELRPREAIDFVRESWKKLRDGNMGLREYATSENPDAFQIIKLTHGMCDLISEADLLLFKCQTQDFLELPMFPHEDLDACAWRDEQLQMASSIVQHGFSIYAKDSSNKGSNMGSNTKTDLTWEILACTNNMTSDKLCERDLETTGISLAASNILLEREMKSGLFNRVKSLVPSRSYLALKGYAFHEYLSSLGCILRSEAFRSTESSNNTKKRRGRGSRHYLSSGALMLSPEDISVLVQSNSYGKGSSQSEDSGLR